MYVVRDSLTGEVVSSDYWTPDAAALAAGGSELLVVESCQAFVPGDLDMGLSARSARQRRPFDPQGHCRRRVENLLSALEYEFHTGSRALWDFYVRGGAWPADMS